MLLLKKIKNFFGLEEQEKIDKKLEKIKLFRGYVIVSRINMLIKELKKEFL